MQSESAYRYLLIVSLASAAATFLAWGTGASAFVGPAAIAALALLAISCQGYASLKIFTFTLWVVSATVAALFYPAAFLSWGGFELSRLNVPLIQLIMFGMGASLSFSDFTRALKVPKAVLIGMFLQFTVMPLAGPVAPGVVDGGDLFHHRDHCRQLPRQTPHRWMRADWRRHRGQFDRVFAGGSGGPGDWPQRDR